MGKVKDEGGMMKDELCYSHCDDFPGETFRVLKEKEIKQFGDAPQVGRDV